MPLYRLNIPVGAINYEAQAQGDGFHIQLQVDATAPAQDMWDDGDGAIYSADSESSQENWAYRDGGVWKPIPATGVPWRPIGESYIVRWRTEEPIGLGDTNYNLRIRTYNGIAYGDPFDIAADFVIDLLFASKRYMFAGINFWNFARI
jgi:hypothetical protein